MEFARKGLDQNDSGMMNPLKEFFENKAQAQSKSRDPYELTRFLIDKINNSRARQNEFKKKGLHTMSAVPKGMMCATNKDDSESNLQNLQPIKVTDLRFGVQKGKYLLVKTMCESDKMTSIMTVGGDYTGVGMRIAVYNLAEDCIPLGTNIIIKEPFYKEAGDLVPMIRVDNPSDCIFDAERLFRNQQSSKNESSEQKKRAAELHKLQYKFLVQEVQPGKLVIATLDQRRFEKTKRIVIQLNEKFIESDVSHLALIGTDTFEVHVDNTILTDQVASFFKDYPGSLVQFFCLEEETSFNPLALFEDKLRKISQPLAQAVDFMKLFDLYNKSAKNALQDVYEIWEENCDILLEESKSFSKKTVAAD